MSLSHPQPRDFIARLRVLFAGNTWSNTNSTKSMTTFHIGLVIGPASRTERP